MPTASASPIYCHANTHERYLAYLSLGTISTFPSQDGGWAVGGGGVPCGGPGRCVVERGSVEEGGEGDCGHCRPGPATPRSPTRALAQQHVLHRPRVAEELGLGRANGIWDECPVFRFAETGKNQSRVSKKKNPRQETMTECRRPQM